MIIADKKTNNVVSGFDSTAFKIDSNNMVKVLSMLSKLYKNPFAFITEIVSNSWDSHIEADCPGVPIEIELNKNVSGENYLCFKDWGVGMSPDRINNIYCNYGSSTKSDTNDLIGNFGIGSKSFFAYTDKKYISTVYNNIQYEYIVYKNEADQPSITLLSEKNTTEKNRTFITVFIESKDVTSVCHVIKRKITYFDNLVFNGKYIEHLNQTKLYYFNNNKFVYNSKEPYNNIHLLLGQVSYEINYTELGISNVELPFALRFDIGEIQPTPTREDIYYTDEAKKLIIARIKELADYMVTSYNKKDFILECPWEWIDKRNQSSVFELPGVNKAFSLSYTNNLRTIEPEVYKLKFFEDSLVKINLISIGNKMYILHNFILSHILDSSGIKYQKNTVKNKLFDAYALEPGEKTNFIKNKWLIENKGTVQLLKRELLEKDKLLSLLNIRFLPEKEQQLHIDTYMAFNNMMWEKYPKYKDIVVPKDFKVKKEKVVKTVPEVDSVVAYKHRFYDKANERVLLRKENLKGKYVVYSLDNFSDVARKLSNTTNVICVKVAKAAFKTLTGWKVDMIHADSVFTTDNKISRNFSLSTIAMNMVKSNGNIFNLNSLEFLEKYYPNVYNKLKLIKDYSKNNYSSSLKDDVDLVNKYNYLSKESKQLFKDVEEISKKFDFLKHFYIQEESYPVINDYIKLKKIKL
jgi:Histidine kinase-, DNA gyrase B-, and HSP90-like ATPase